MSISSDFLLAYQMLNIETPCNLDSRLQSTDKKL